MMVLLIPSEGMAGYESILAFQERVGWNFDFSIKDFLITITIGAIMFTLFIKATTIKSLMNYWEINKLNPSEEFSRCQGNIIANIKILQKLDTLKNKQYLTSEEYETLQKTYEANLADAKTAMMAFIKTLSKTEKDEIIQKSIRLHALGVEKQYLKNLFTYNEIPRDSFTYILKKITRQIERVSVGKSQLKSESEKNEIDIFEKLTSSSAKPHFSDLYIRHRTQAIITRKVIKDIRQVRSVDFGFSEKYYDEILEVYEMFNSQANEQKDKIFQAHKAEISVLEAKLTEKSLLKAEENLIEDLYTKEIITPKLYANFIDTIENGIQKDVKSIG